jgi:hypothetical protein
MMKFNLVDTLLLAGAVGFFSIWLPETQRTSFADSYLFLLAALTCLLAFQLLRVRRQQQEQTVSPTVQQMAETRRKAAEKKANPSVTTPANVRAKSAVKKKKRA